MVIVSSLLHLHVHVHVHVHMMPWSGTTRNLTIRTRTRTTRTVSHAPFVKMCTDGRLKPIAHHNPFARLHGANQKPKSERTFSQTASSSSEDDSARPLVMVDYIASSSAQDQRAPQPCRPDHEESCTPTPPACDAGNTVEALMDTTDAGFVDA